MAWWLLSVQSMAQQSVSRPWVQLHSPTQNALTLYTHMYMYMHDVCQHVHGCMVHGLDTFNSHDLAEVS